jgi:hypothetical protein
MSWPKFKVEKHDIKEVVVSFEDQFGDQAVSVT